MYVKRIQLTNYGPIDRLDLTFPFDGDTPRPVVLVGANGSGKSIVLSHIVNGLLWAQQAAYSDTAEVTPNRVYKLRNPSYVKSGRAFSYTRTEFENGVHVRDFQLPTIRQPHDNPPPDATDDSVRELWNQVPVGRNNKFEPTGFDAKRVEELFQQNCVLYFPPDRFEDPAWLNERNLTARARHMKPPYAENHTNRLVISTSPLQDNQNWLFGLAYDYRVLERQVAGPAQPLYDGAVEIVRTILHVDDVRLEIGPRHDRAIAVATNHGRVSNIFQLSSGEVSLLNLFLSILRDFDSSRAQLKAFADVRGIVVVDEVDLHLHAIHQHEVLPRLMQLFPRVQFVLTTHSPLFVLGLQHTLGGGAFSLYRLPDGDLIHAEEFSEFGNAYRAFQKTRAHADALEAAIAGATHPLLYVEGDTDVKYLRRAIELLRDDSLGHIEVLSAGGDKDLNKIWNALTKTRTREVTRRMVVLLYDCEGVVESADDDKFFRRKAPLMTEGHPIDKGIENLFSRDTLERARENKPDLIDVIDSHKETVRGVPRVIPERWEVNKDEKTNLCDWLCANGTAEDFRHFRAVFDELLEIPGLRRTASTDVDKRG